MSTPAQLDAIYRYTYNVATDAYIYGYAPVNLWILMSQNVNDPTKAPFNKLKYYETTSTPTVSPYPGPNVDTIYTIGWLDVTNTPILLISPNGIGQNRWWDIQIEDIYMNTTRNVPGLNKNVPPNVYFIVGPNYTGPDLYNMIRSPTNIIYVTGRTEIKNGDVAGAVAFSKAIQVIPLNPAAPVLSIAPLTNAILSTMDYYVNLVQILNYAGYPPIEEPVITQFRTIKLNPDVVPFNPAILSPTETQAYLDAIVNAREKIIPQGNLYAAGANVSNFWTGGTLLGNYGFEYLRRAYVAFTGSVNANVAKEQFYPATFRDGSGAILNGASHDYNIHFPPGLFSGSGRPSWAFDSITVYLLANNQLFANPYNRYAVGSNTGQLVFNPDGSLDIPLLKSPPSPSLPGAANWLPIPSVPFILVFRRYAPSNDQIVNMVVPPVLPIS